MAHIYGIGATAEHHVAAAGEIARTVAARHAVDVDARGRFPEESMAALARAGFYGLCLPVEAGGHGEGPRTFAAVVETLAEACASTAMVYVMHVTAAQAIASSSTLAGKADLLRAMASGRHLTTLAFSEKGSRSQFWAPVSKLTESGSGWTTSAYKSWVTSAGHADSYVSSAQRPGAGSPLESTVYLCHRGRSGMRHDSGFDGLGLRGNDSAPVVLEDYRVDEGDLISALGEGAGTMLQVVLPWFSVGTAAMAHGLCRAAIGATSAHLQGTGFEHTGTQLRDLPNLRARLAVMSVRADQSRALLGFTAGEMESPNGATPLYVLQSRMSALDTALEVTDLAMKACGGAAFSRQLGVERFFRDARAGWVMAPTVDHLSDFIGKALTGLPLF